MAQDGKASTMKKTFSRETSVSISIQADPAIVWALLTNASDYPRWNSTIISIEGEIGFGGKINLKSTLDEKRTFKLKVKEFQPEKQMVWRDGKGNRTFSIANNADGIVIFEMWEKIGGLMFPMYATFIPPFDEAFEQFASDLKKEAELISKTNN
ncbi:MAG: SRPBCC family protein [Cyclobacteriaceae bacterium]